MFVLGFPLLLVPFVVYNIIAFIFGLPDDFWTSPVATAHMMSGRDWVLTWGDILLAFSVFLLWVEIIKSTRLGTRSVMDHILAMALFIAMLAEFLLVPRAANSTFFLLTVFALFDMLVGFMTGMRSNAPRQIEIEDPGQG
jgi:hypothetical protein